MCRPPGLGVSRAVSKAPVFDENSSQGPAAPEQCFWRRDDDVRSDSSRCKAQEEVMEDKYGSGEEEKRPGRSHRQGA
jgi:hypothetical protein